VHCWWPILISISPQAPSISCVSLPPFQPPTIAFSILRMAWNVCSICFGSILSRDLAYIASAKSAAQVINIRFQLYRKLVEAMKRRRSELHFSAYSKGQSNTGKDSRQDTAGQAAAPLNFGPGRGAARVGGVLGESRSIHHIVTRIENCPIIGGPS